MINYLNDFFLEGTIKHNPLHESHFCFRIVKQRMGVLHHDDANLAFSVDIGQTSQIVTSVFSMDQGGKTFTLSLNCGFVSRLSDSNQGRYLAVTSHFALMNAL